MTNSNSQYNISKPFAPWKNQSERREAFKNTPKKVREEKQNHDGNKN